MNPYTEFQQMLNYIADNISNLFDIVLQGRDIPKNAFIFVDNNHFFQWILKNNYKKTMATSTAAQLVH